jgi:hypothetical protein
MRPSFALSVRRLLRLIFVRNGELLLRWLHDPAWAGAKGRGAWRLPARSGSFWGMAGVYGHDTREWLVVKERSIGVAFLPELLGV